MFTFSYRIEKLLDAMASYWFFVHTNILKVLQETKFADNKWYDLLDIDAIPYMYSGTSSRHPSQKSLMENDYEKGLIKQ